MRLTKAELRAQAILPLPIEYQPEPTSFCHEQPKWERHAIVANWLDHSLHPKAVAHRKRMEQFRAELAEFALIAPEWEKKRQQQLYERRRDAGLIFNDPPNDAVAFWYDPKFGLDFSMEHSLGMWVNSIQMAGLLRRGMASEFLVSAAEIRLTPHQDGKV